MLMKTRTSALALHLAVVTMASALTDFFAIPAAAQVQDFQYTIHSGEVTITGYGGPGGEVTIPSTINSLPVTRIGPNAFSSHTGLTSVTIPNSVT